MTLRCMSHVPPLTKPKLITNPITGYPDVRHDRCGQVVGLSAWEGHHGQQMVACGLPGHRQDVEAQDAPYRVDPDFAHRMRHEMEENEREAAHVQGN